MINKSKENAIKDKKAKTKGFQRNELKEENKHFFLGNKTENIEHLSIIFIIFAIFINF